MKNAVMLYHVHTLAVTVLKQRMRDKTKGDKKMGYIRSNEDWYISQGMSPKEAHIQEAIDEAHLDYGYCDPRKAKDSAEDEQVIRDSFRSKQFSKYPEE